MTINPPWNERTAIELERRVCPKSLIQFTKSAWPIIDPSEVYLHNWHMDCIAEHLEAAAISSKNRQSDPVNRLLINVPPGTSKSSIASVYFPAWLWGPFGWPSARIIGASHQEPLATRDNRRSRMLIKSPWFQKRWPIDIASDQDAKRLFENEAMGFRESTAVTGMTGKRGHFIIWDDPHTVKGAVSQKETQREEVLTTFKEVLPSRLVSPEHSVIIIIMQRLHEKDVSGHILANDLGYTHVMLPMEFDKIRRCYSVVKPRFMQSEPERLVLYRKRQQWMPKEKLEALLAKVPGAAAEQGEIVEKTVYNVDPRTEPGQLLFEGRFPRHVVERDKVAMGAAGAAGQLQQQPTPRGGLLFNRKWFTPIDQLPQGYRWVRGWDLAGTTRKTSAWTAGVLIGRQPFADGRFCIANVKRFKEGPAGVKKMMKTTANSDAVVFPGVKGSFPRDPGQAGLAQQADLVAHLAPHSYRATPETGSKVDRATPLSAQAEAGNVDMLIGDWNEAFLDEMELFPLGEFADQVDAASRGFMELVTMTESGWHVAGDD